MNNLRRSRYEALIAKIAEMLADPNIESMVLVRVIRKPSGAAQPHVFTYGTPPELTAPLLRDAAQQIESSEFSEEILVRGELQ